MKYEGRNMTYGISIYKDEGIHEKEKWEGNGEMN